jgi:exodeoxyribonuclease VII large subunit
VRQRQLKCENLAGRLARIHPEQALKLRRERLNQLQKRLNSLGPEQVLARGYAIARDEKSGKVLRDAMETGAGQRIRVRLHRGEVAGRVEK